MTASLWQQRAQWRASSDEWRWSPSSALAAIGLRRCQLLWRARHLRALSRGLQPSACGQIEGHALFSVLREPGVVQLVVVVTASFSLIRKVRWLAEVEQSCPSGRTADGHFWTRAWAKGACVPCSSSILTFEAHVDLATIRYRIVVDDTDVIDVCLR